MARLIDADAVEPALVKWIEDMSDFRHRQQVIDDISTVDAEPVRHGRWVYGDDVDIQCSACGVDALNETGYSLQVKSNYCPNCGAKMDGGAEE